MKRGILDLPEGKVFGRLVAKLFLETGGKIGRTAETGFKRDLRDIVVALPEQFQGLVQPEFPDKSVGGFTCECNQFAIQLALAVTRWPDKIDGFEIDVVPYRIGIIH